MLRLKQHAHMVGYNEGQILELFKNNLSTRYYYLLSIIQTLREAVEGAKRVMPKEILYNKLMGQSFAPYTSLKTHSSVKTQIVRNGEHKLLHSEIDRLTE